MRIIIVGMGGVGSHLINPLCRYLSSKKEDTQLNTNSVFIFDGDKLEEKNLLRQEFSLDSINQSKSATKANELKSVFSNISISGINEFITSKNIKDWIFDGDIIFSCVDNHNTRKLISDYCKSLNNVVFISGGNEIYDGNIQVYIKKYSKEITPPITQDHPEIDNPKDKNPSEMSCAELEQSGTPQIIFTNLMVSCLMLNAFFNIINTPEEKLTNFYSEVYFDIIQNKTRPVYKVINLQQGQDNGNN